MLPALQLLEVVRTYRAGVNGCSATARVLDGVTLQVAEGEIVGVAGEAGSGKTTLMQVAAGAQRPDHGAVSWFGVDSRSAPRPPRIALVPAFGVHYRFLTVREALEYYATLQDLADARRAARVERTIERIALAELADTRIARLTAGQLQRVGLAQALVTDPRLLLLDATLDALDGDASAVVSRLLVELAGSGVAILVAGRVASRLARVAHRAYRLSDGRIRPAARAPAWLELDVTAPGIDADRLRSRVPSVAVREGRLRVDLDEATPEEILAHCRQLGIDVQRSAVVPP